MDSYTQILKNGLWANNQAFVALLGLCPLLAVSKTVINGLGLGIATTLTLILSNTIVSIIRHHVGNEIRLPVFVLIIASIVTAIELIMNAFFYELYLILGIFIPLIVTNCSIIGRAEAYASKNPVGASAIDGFAMGTGFTAALVILGAMREIVGSGTLLANAPLNVWRSRSRHNNPRYFRLRRFLISHFTARGIYRLRVNYCAKKRY